MFSGEFLITLHSYQFSSTVTGRQGDEMPVFLLSGISNLNEWFSWSSPGPLWGTESTLLFTAVSFRSMLLSLGPPPVSGGGAGLGFLSPVLGDLMGSSEHSR